MNHQRQIDILDPKLFRFPITLIGCGGIGSPTALLLAKVGCPSLTLMDPDIVEAHNLPNQLFRLTDAGSKDEFSPLPKVIALKQLIKEFSECQITPISQPFDASQKLSGIVISGVDTMASRKVIWERVKYNIDVPLYIDARIGGEVIEVFSIHPMHFEDIEFYEKWIFPDDKAAELPCTARAIMYTGFLVSSFIVSQVAKWLRDEKVFRRMNFDLKTMTSIFV